MDNREFVKTAIVELQRPLTHGNWRFAEQRGLDALAEAKDARRRFSDALVDALDAKDRAIEVASDMLSVYLTRRVTGADFMPDLSKIAEKHWGKGKVNMPDLGKITDFANEKVVDATKPPGRKTDNCQIIADILYDTTGCIKTDLHGKLMAVLDEKDRAFQMAIGTGKGEVKAEPEKRTENWRAIANILNRHDSKLITPECFRALEALLDEKDMALMLAAGEVWDFGLLKGRPNRPAPPEIAEKHTKRAKEICRELKQGTKEEISGRLDSVGGLGPDMKQATEENARGREAN